MEVSIRDGCIWVRSPYPCTSCAGEDGPFRAAADGFPTVGDRLHLPQLPLTAAGKVDRVAASELLASGRLTATASTGSASTGRPLS